MFADYHNHSTFSDDGHNTLEEMVQQAITLGIDEICFTEHIDYGVKFGDGNCNIDRFQRELFQLKEKYKESIIIKFGMEFGVQRHRIEEYNKTFSEYPFDFIICSIHQIDDLEFWTNDFQRGKNQDEINLKYYEELLEVVKTFKNYSVLGHLDVIRRYDEYGDYPFDKVKDSITEIFKIVIADGKGIEVNTSSYRYQLKDTTPSLDILKLYKELGGTIITIGSDSHRIEHVGAMFNETKEMLKELGFEYAYTYEAMKAIPYKL